VSEDNLFEHVKKVDKFHDALTKDAATEEQAKEQLTVADKDALDANDDAQEDDQDVVMKDDEEVIDDQDTNEMDPEKVAQSKKKGKRRGDPKPIEEDDEETKMEGTTSLYRFKLDVILFK